MAEEKKKISKGTTKKTTSTKKKTTTTKKTTKKKTEEPKKTIGREEKPESIQVQCTFCGAIKEERHFYKSNSITNRFTKRMNICKDCIVEAGYELYKEDVDIYNTIFRLCRLLDLPYIRQSDAYADLVTQAVVSIGEQGFDKTSAIYIKKIIGWYIAKVNTLPQFRGFTFENSTCFVARPELEGKKEDDFVDHRTDLDIKNEESIIRQLGYDPFEGENRSDRPVLFNQLIDFMGDSDLIEDVQKLDSVISIIKTMNQRKYIDSAIAEIMKNMASVETDTSQLKKLVDIKKIVNETILKLCADNGITQRFNKNKAQGGNTLAGILSKLSIIGYDAVEINAFDINTSRGMQQVADMSTQAIMNQLNFTEAEYVDMLKQAREERVKADRDKEALEEELRIAKKVNSDLENMITKIREELRANYNINLKIEGEDY